MSVVRQLKKRTTPYRLIYIGRQGYDLLKNIHPPLHAMDFPDPRQHDKTAHEVSFLIQEIYKDFDQCVVIYTSLYLCG